MDDDNQDKPCPNSQKPFRITLPPINLPPVRLPTISFEQFKLSMPPRVHRRRNRILAAVVIDCVDAIILFTAFGGLLGVLGGTLLTMMLVGPLGILYAWESIPHVLNSSLVAVYPSATTLTLVIERVSSPDEN